ncbi:S-layer homology domain-containing protein [Paenibacillus daejeonensis]|uniref:S-layer homology domain-containing protein n=1 Tax=Paenibacillus daejeonensis TaxID=135193 RepID=UPI000365F2A6|nr:S-layer homology domain-containing protein [Paenibacillus daejeonensis]
MRFVRLKRLLSMCLAVLLALSALQLFVPAGQAQAAPQTVPISLQLNNMDSLANSTGDTVGTAGIAVVANSDSDYIREGTGSKKWLLAFNDASGTLTAGAALIYPKHAPQVDLNGFETLKIWAYSVKARTGDQADKPIQLRFFMKGDTANYYYYRLPLDWTGWKEIEVPLAVVQAQRSSADVKPWGALDYIRFDQAGVSGTTLDAGLQVYLDDMRLTSNGELHPVVADKPAGEYTNAVTVALSTQTRPASLAEVYYKRAGVDDAFLRYSTPITLTEDTTLLVKTVLHGVESEETAYPYTIVYRDVVEPVEATPRPGTYAESKTVALTSTTEDASIFYKIEGVDSDFRLYAEPLLVDTSRILTTYAVVGEKVSETSSHAYTIDLSGSGSYPISDMEGFTGWTNTTLDSKHPVLGEFSGRWTNPVAAINVTGITAPWDEHDQIEFWLYSEKASNKKIYFILQTPDNDIPGNEYFMSTFFVDWSGWKKIELPFNRMLNSNGHADFSNFTQLIIHPRWYGSDPEPDPTDVLYFDGMALAKNAIEPSVNRINKSALPGAELEYTFLLRNIGGTDTAYGIAPKVPFAAGYEVDYEATTDVVADGEETEVSFRVQVPEEAQAGDTAQAIFAVRPLQGGKEIAIELNIAVGERGNNVKQHPYVMTSVEELEAAKAKLQTYTWAQDYLAAVRAKADDWVNKTIYYPSKPAGATTWFVCGDVTLVYNYDSPHAHLCPSDGQMHTGEQVDAGWRFTTHTLNVQAARNLAIVYALTDEVKYASKAKEILVNYAKLYPEYPLQAQNGRLFYQSLDEAVQMIELVHAYDLIESSGVLSEAEKQDIEQNLFAPSARTLQAYDVGKSNWQTWHNAAIGTIGAVLEDEALMEHSVNGRSGFHFQMTNSVLSDGFWYEGAIGYHVYAQYALLHHAIGLRGMGYDLFASEPFKKTFDMPLDYAFPDLGIINSNNSSKYPTSLAAPGRVVPMDYEAVYAHYNDPVYGALLDRLYEENGRPRGGYIVAGDPTSGIAGEQALFFGKPVIDNVGEWPSASRNFEGLGHAVLRSGTGNDQLYALVDYGNHGGYHGHFDKLHLEVFGQGERLAPDKGIPAYSNSMFETYYKKTFAHNTVTVDGDTQQIPTENGAEIHEPTKLFLPGEAFGIMTNSSTKAYAGMQRYERTVAVTGDYLIDLFTVASDTPRQYDWLLHGLGEFTPGSELTPMEEALGTKDAYPFFQNGQQAELEEAWSGEWRLPSGNGLKLHSLTSSPEQSSVMIVGEAPGPANDTSAYSTSVVNRIKDRQEAQFVSVIEPLSGESGIESVRRTASDQMEIKLKDGRTQVFYFNGALETEGELQYYWADGNGYQAADVTVEAALAGTELQLTAGTPAGVSGVTAIVYAPGTTRVLWNGEQVDYTEDNGFVRIQFETDPGEEPPVLPPGWSGPSFPPVSQSRVERFIQPAVAAELALGDAIRVSVPVGAMGESTRYVIEQVKDEQLLQRLFEGGLKPLSGIFEITKDKEGNFLVPIRIRLAFDPSLLTEGQEPAIHYYDEQQQQWVDMGGTVAESFIEVTSNHLTKFVVLAVDSELAEPEASGEPSGPGEQLTLSDIGGHWAEAEIRKGLQAGYVKGYPDGTFQPSRPVTRAEFVVMLMNALQPQGPSAALPDFRDAGTVPDWARPSVSQAVQSGLVQGYEDGSFRPGARLTRAQLAVILAGALDSSAEAGGAVAFADAAAIPAWALPAVSRVREAGLMRGRDGNRFVPQADMSRAEAITVIVRLMTFLEE